MQGESEKSRSVLERRARELAKPVEDHGVEDGTELLVFELCGERYALESAMVREIRRLQGLTALSGVPSFVLGIMNVRGEILSVLDPVKILALPETAYEDGARVVVLSDGAMTFGLAVHGLHGMARRAFSKLQEAPLAGKGFSQGLIRGVSADRLIVLDGKALLAEKTLIVDGS